MTRTEKFGVFNGDQGVVVAGLFGRTCMYWIQVHGVQYFPRHSPRKAQCPFGSSHPRWCWLVEDSWSVLRWLQQFHPGLSLSLFPFLSLLWIWLKMKLKHVFGCVGGLCAKCIGFSSACTTGWPESKVYLCWTGKFVGPIDVSHFKETKILTFTGLIDENPHTSVIMLGFSYLGPIWWII